MEEDSLERYNVIVLFLINNDVWVCYKNNEIFWKNGLLHESDFLFYILVVWHVLKIKGQVYFPKNFRWSAQFFINKISNCMSSYPRLIPLLCSNCHQIWYITSLSYVSALKKILKQVINKTENNLSLKVKF